MCERIFLSKIPQLVSDDQDLSHNFPVVSSGALYMQCRQNSLLPLASEGCGAPGCSAENPALGGADQGWEPFAGPSGHSLAVLSGTFLPQEVKKATGLYEHRIWECGP